MCEFLNLDDLLRFSGLNVQYNNIKVVPGAPAGAPQGAPGFRLSRRPQGTGSNCRYVL